MKRYVLYHDPCLDGMGAKFAAWEKFKDHAVYLPVNYDRPAPEMESGSEIFIFDFSYPKEFLRDLNARSNRLIVLDHHASAQRALEGEPYAIFDMTQSGAVLAWKYLHPGIPVPDLLKHIQDRDLWKWEMPWTKEVTNAISVKNGDMVSWEQALNVPESLLQLGKGIEEYKGVLIEAGTDAYSVRRCVWRGHNIAVVNTAVLPSEIGAVLYKDLAVDFSLTWHISGEGRVAVNLRSRKGPNEVDVSKIAETFGGGGHPSAAGFKTDLGLLTEIYS